MNTEQIAELREHLEELHGLLECETDLHGGATLTAHNLRVAILNIENELAATPCGHCSYVFDSGRVVTYWRNETALNTAGLHTGYLCRKCADAREIKAGE